MNRVLALLLTMALLTVGCIGTTNDDTTTTNRSDAMTAHASPNTINISTDLDETGPFTVPVSNAMTFNESIVDAAIGYTNDLYEPTMEVSDNGVIYVTGHTILVDTTGAPVFKSADGGETWEQLPFVMDQTMPAGIHGATPPPSDEIFLTAGDNGWLYGVDITAATFPVNMWKNDGNEFAYHNPNAYDRADATASGQCGADALNDRPWGVYANGKLFMVSNPGTGTVQIGVMDVPPDGTAGVPGNPVTGPTWNMCAAQTSYIPGIPDMREDHFFAVPFQSGDHLNVITGNAENVNHVDEQSVMPFENTASGTSNYGQAVFDAEGDLFLGIRHNPDTSDENATTGLRLATSTDSGDTFVNRTLAMDSPVTSLYMDGNMHGPGALLSWGQESENGTDWYGAHLSVGDDGGPVVENVSLILKDGPPPSAHVQGAAVGPDGESYIVTFHGGYMPQDQATPIHTWIQDDGPRLPTPLAE